MQGVRRALRRGAQTATLLVLGVWSAAAQAPDDLRIALVIGNAAYPEPATLANQATTQPR
jgi:hypothetical protein